MFIERCLHQLNLSFDTISLNVKNIRTKRTLIKEKSFSLWHECLAHISKERIDKLVKNQILPQLIPNNFKICMSCIKGKLTQTRKLTNATYNDGHLKLIHSHIH